MMRAAVVVGVPPVALVVFLYEANVPPDQGLRHPP